MNYSMHYSLLILKARLRKPQEGVYYEKHHVWPKCLGGDNKKDNLVMLTAEEHYVAHQLLVKIFPNEHGLVKACVQMCRDRYGNRVNNKLYGWIRRRLAENYSKYLSNIPKSEEAREKMKIAQQARVKREKELGIKRHIPSLKGYKFSEEEKELVYSSRRKVYSDEEKLEKYKSRRLGTGNGKKHTEETKELLRERRKEQKPHKHSEETKRKMSESRKRLWELKKLKQQEQK